VNKKITISNSYNSQTIDRAFSILFTFYENPNIDSLTSLEISELVNIPHSTVFRLLSILQSWGLIEKNETTKEYRLGVACLRLGSAYLAKNDLRAKSTPLLKNLRDETGETVHLAIRDGTEVVYLEKFDGLHSIGVMSSRVGGRSPIYCTAVGKILLAFLPSNEIKAVVNSINLTRFTKNTITEKDKFIEELINIKANGFSRDNEEHEVDVACIAAPIFNHEGNVVSALSISGPAERINDNGESNKLIEKVISCARKTSDNIGGGIYLK